MSTAFVLAGGGSLDAVQIGMLKALCLQHITSDFVVGALVGAINAACFATEPDEQGVARLERMPTRPSTSKSATSLSLLSGS